jgi:hypothetical protein
MKRVFVIALCLYLVSQVLFAGLVAAWDKGPIYCFDPHGDRFYNVKSPLTCGTNERITKQEYEDQEVEEKRRIPYAGQGTLTFASGQKYVGEYRNGKKHGQGTYTWPDGYKYVGEWKDGKEHGQGTYTKANGSKYVGEWKYGKMHGQGTYTWSDGSKYVGEFKNGKENGQGTYTKANGYKFVGEFREDERWDGVAYSTSGLVEGNYSNGKWCMGCAPTTRQLAIVREIKTNRKLVGTGTGFIINKNYIVTADHVVDGCNEVTVRHNHKEYWTTIAARDSSNDLGLLRVKESLEHNAKLRGGKAIRLGESISTYGYPLFGELSDSAKVTQGNINSLAGMGNDSGVIQYDAPSQPGNSGGPVLDRSAHVVGVVSAGLSKRYADQSGHIAQNVNFAIKSYLVEGFLSSSNVSFEKADSTEKLELPDIAEKAEMFTVLVGCWE